MPPLKNPRHERFAQELAKGATQDDAYVAAGFKPSRHHASRLATNGNIRTRVSELQSKVAEKAEWSAAERLLMLKAIALANSDKDARVTVSAISEANKMQGSHAPAKAELTGKGGGPVQIADLSRLKGMTAEELQVLERALVQIGIAEGDQDGTGEPEE
jgi:phage terminase small subunit